jgi:hypothetical protein
MHLTNITTKQDLILRLCKLYIQSFKSKPEDGFQYAETCSYVLLNPYNLNQQDALFAINLFH